MESERIEEWIDKVSIMGGEMILVRDLEDLLKREALVPRMIDDNIVSAGRSKLRDGVSMYNYEIVRMFHAMIEEAERV